MFVNRVFPHVLASGVTLSSSYDFGGSFRNVYLEIPTMASGSDFYVQGSSDGAAFKRVMHPVVNTSSIQIQTFVIGSAATGKMVPVPAGFRYMKVELSTALTDTTSTFNFICGE